MAVPVVPMELTWIYCAELAVEGAHSDNSDNPVEVYGRGRCDTK